MKHVTHAATAALLSATAPIAGAVTLFDFSSEILFDRLGFVAGQPVTGSLAFDETAPDTSPDVEFGLYGPPSITSLELSVGGNPILARTLGGSNIVVDIARLNEDRVTYRGAGIAFAGAVSDCDDTASCFLELAFFDASELLLAGNAPAEALPSVTQLGAFAPADRIASIITGGTSVQFRIDTLTPRSIPEPSSVLLAAGLFAAAIARKRAAA